MNKNFYLMAWAMELVQQGKLDFIPVSFLLAGHTKFSSDLLFSRIVQTYNRSNVFTTEELKEIAAQYASVVIDDGSIVCDWRNVLTNYSKLPGIRSLHDFVFTRHPTTKKVLAKVSTNCFGGTFSDAAIKVLRGRNIGCEVCRPEFRGKTFRSLLAQISEIRSLLLGGV